MVSRVIKVPPFDIVIFGATGDLAQRKIFPALYHRTISGQLPDEIRIIGCARSKYDSEGFRDFICHALNEHIKDFDPNNASVSEFISKIQYVPGDLNDCEVYKSIKELLTNKKANAIQIFYLSVSPSFFEAITSKLKKNEMVKNARLVVEKPFGHDLESASTLNKQIANAFDEKFVYRIDHYLGKETVQNLIALRFANALFEPLWNSRHIDHIQITASETLGVEGRGEYYGKVGAMRDMIQNHLLQLLCLTAMEPPHAFDADAVRDEKLKVLKSLSPMFGHAALKDTVRGQYLGNSQLTGFIEEVGDVQCLTETYVAIKAEVLNWRWADTPFYLRTGKRLRNRLTEIAIYFKDPHHSIFDALETRLKPNVLVIRLQPDEGLTLSIMTKDPGPGGFRLKETPLDMSFASGLGESWKMPDAYERLLLDVVRGNQTLFMRRDEVELAWKWIDPIIEAWENSGEKPEMYESGGSGPDLAIELLARDGRRWKEII